jgi:hypothetical protein
MHLSKRFWIMETLIKSYRNYISKLREENLNLRKALRELLLKEIERGVKNGQYTKFNGI